MSASTQSVRKGKTKTQAVTREKGSLSFDMAVSELLASALYLERSLDHMAGTFCPCVETLMTRVSRYRCSGHDSQLMAGSLSGAQHHHFVLDGISVSTS